MVYRLEDSMGVIWLLGVGTDGLLTTTVSAGSTTTLFLSAGGSIAYQVGVDTTGLLTTTLVSNLGYPTSIFLEDSNDNSWMLTVLSIGLLQTTFVGINVWRPNGFGAGTDNRVVGGTGGFMAYPQPPSPIEVYTTPEANGQFGALNITFNNGTGNQFVISNPGRR